MKYVIVSGSHRLESQSHKVARWLSGHMKERQHTVHVVNLGEEEYPFWDDTYWDKNSDLYKSMKEELSVLDGADGLILVAPEWHGMVPAALKNYLLYLSQDIVGHLPTVLVGISADRGGAYPIAELRMSSSKNSRLLYLPEHLIVRDVGQVMNAHDVRIGEEADVYIKERALYVLDHLDLYAQGMQLIRKQGRLFDERYKFGM